MNTEERLVLAATAAETFTRLEWDGGLLRGIAVVDDDLRDLVSKLVKAHLVEHAVEYTGDASSDLPEDFLRRTDRDGVEVAVVLQPPRSQEAFFARDLQELLDRVPYLCRAPRALYLLDSRYLSSRDQPRDAVAAYFDAVEVAGLLEDLSDYWRTEGGSIAAHILGRDRLTVTINYSADDLCPVSLVRNVRADLCDGLHTTDKRTILKAVLCESLRGVEESGRFRHLVARFTEVVSRYRDNYALFVSDFSFEKVREEAETRRLEFIAKINTVIATIQDKILAIPVSVVLVGATMDAAKTVSFKNTVILSGALVFAVLMILLLRNQSSTLEAIHYEIVNQQKTLATKYPALEGKLDPVFDSVFRRYAQQRSNVRMLNLLVLVCAVFAVCMFVWRTESLLLWWVATWNTSASWLGFIVRSLPL